MNSHNNRFKKDKYYDVENNIIFDDDGGAAKGDDRRLRRERRRWATTLLSFFGFMFLLLIYSRSSEHRAAKEERRKNTRDFYRAARKGDPLEPDWLTEWKELQNVGGTNEKEDGGGQHYRWSDPRLLPPIPGKTTNTFFEENQEEARFARHINFRINRGQEPPMAWESDADDDGRYKHESRVGEGGVDYTKHDYIYPNLLDSPPTNGQYPPLEPLHTVLKRWPQDDLDTPPSPFVERLLHFDYSNPEEMEAAVRFRDAELPFKVYNVPELDLANEKWTDEYLASEFRDPKGNNFFQVMKPLASGTAQESLDNFFSFYKPEMWDVKTMGPPPTINNDWSYAQWSKHARYADKVKLPTNARHFYWQSGVPPDERHKKKSEWCFISRDLPSFSSPKPTFFGFDPSKQKGIQCRFGERGVTAATHYDAGRNMVAMITGAKRYILSPPKACPKLGIVTTKFHPAWRHSLLNFGHMNLLDDGMSSESMPPEEKAWLEIAKDAPTIDTVLKAGEVLYIPSHWFHYIVSLQKSAQCNTRSGRHFEGNPNFGGFDDVIACVGEGA